MMSKKKLVESALAFPEEPSESKVVGNTVPAQVVDLKFRENVDLSILYEVVPQN